MQLKKHRAISEVLGAATCALLGTPSQAADWNVDINTHYYDLKPGLIVIKPQVSVTRNLSLETSVNAKLTADQVDSTTTSNDTTSGASQTSGNTKNIDDLREEYFAGVTHLHEDWKIEVGYLLSKEKDYRSHTPSAVLSRDLHQRNATVSVGYSKNFDRVHGSEMPESKTKGVDNYAVSYTQVLSPVTVAQAGYTLQYAQGYLPTGNRLVKLANGNTMPEYFPSERARHAVGLRMVHMLPTSTAVQVSYRRYQDDWSLDSGTYQLLVSQNLTPAVLLRGEVRYYDQSAADFAKDSYDGSERYLTSASTLREMEAWLYGLKIEYTVSDLRFRSKWERYWQSNGLTGNIFMIAADIGF